MNKQSPNCLDFLELYLNDDFWQLLVQETNRFAGQFFSDNLESTYTREWEPVDIAEMKCFIGLILLMGIIRKPSLPMYWSTEGVLETPIFAQSDET